MIKIKNIEKELKNGIKSFRCLAAHSIQSSGISSEIESYIVQ